MVLKIRKISAHTKSIQISKVQSLTSVPSQLSGVPAASHLKRCHEEKKLQQPPYTIWAHGPQEKQISLQLDLTHQMILTMNQSWHYLKAWKLLQRTIWTQNLTLKPSRPQ